MLALACGLAATFGAADAGAMKNTILRDLMKRMDSYSKEGDLKATAQILGLVRAMGPDEYERWRAMAEKARAAAARGDATATATACRSCHDAYRDQYQSKYGSKAPVDKDD